jgi:membrane protein YdbS with pleckstrin-like domain
MVFKRVKIPEKGSIFKTSRISYVQNYSLVVLAVVFLVLVWPYLHLKILFTSYADLLPFAIFAGFIVLITFLIEEPTIEQIMRKYVVTNNEVVKIEGLLRKKKISIPHGNVSDIRVKKGIVGRIFNFGDIEVTGFRDNIVMKGIKNPDEVYKIIENKVSLMREGLIRKGKETGNVRSSGSGSKIEGSQDLNE